MRTRLAALVAALSLSALAGPPTVYGDPVGVTVTTSATLISSLGRAVYVKVTNDCASVLYVGMSSSVTTTGATRGTPIAAGQWIEYVDLAPNQSIFGIVASGTCTVTSQRGFQQ